MRRAPVIVAILTVVLAGAWYGLHFISADFLYVVEAEFAEVPPDDRELEEWVRAQPGVWKVFTDRRPSGPLTRLVVTIGTTRNGWGAPAFPDLNGRCVVLGYRGQVRQFRDRPDE